MRVVPVERHLDRASAAVVGDSEAADLGDLGLREADGGEDGLLLRADDGDRGVGVGLLARELEHADDVRMVGRLDRSRVERAPGDRRRDPRRKSLVQRVRERLRELRQPVVVALKHRRHDLLVPAQLAA